MANHAIARDVSGPVGETQLSPRPYGWLGMFSAMTSPCEVHVVGKSEADAGILVAAVADEAQRIEAKFSRYLSGNIVDQINNSDGKTIAVDEETARLLIYADQLFDLSDGRFDITSGVLRRAWKFDGGNTVPEPSEVDTLLADVGWNKVHWDNPNLRMRPGMQIDFGGIGKEYAVDRAVLIAAQLNANCLINFGGDLATYGAGIDAAGWKVGIEGVTQSRLPQKAIRIQRGALATSGDSYRYSVKNGKRYGHVLDPRTGWPIEGAPRSVTVAAPGCTEAGMLATFAMLHGANAESFLDAQGATYWCLR